MNHSKLHLLMDKALHQSLTKHNIRIGFMAIGIWPLNLRVMDNITQFSNLYTTIANVNVKKKEGEDDYNSNEHVNGS